MADAWVKHAGTWKQAATWVKHAGTWKQPATWVKRAGTWVPLSAPAAAGGTTWAPAFKHAALTLTNGDKTVTQTSAIGWVSMRTAHPSGPLGSKVYWEIKVETLAADAMYEAFVSVADGGMLNTYYSGQAGLSGGMAPDGGLSGLSGATGFGYVAGDVLQFASDNTAGSATLKIAKNGGAYTTFTGDGIVGVTNVYPAVMTSIVGDSFTIRTTAPEWSFSPPSGYVAIPT